MMEIPARHPRKGDCIIRDLTPTLGRIKVYVDYPVLGLARRPEYLDELVDPRTGERISLEAPSRVEPRPKTVVPVPLWQTARQTLLALRLGQSTHDSVRELSVGMEDVDAACRWAIHRAQTGQLSFVLFESPYGMGKSHALEHLKLLAQQAGMATGSVVLDGIGVSMCLPMSLVGALAHSVEYPEATATDGLPQRLAGLVSQCVVERLRTVGAEFLYGSLANLRAEHVSNPDLWEVIEDYLSLEASTTHVYQRVGVRVHALRARALQDRPSRCADLLCEWAQACTITGARGGLAVLLDEADVDYAQSGRVRTEREQREALLQALRSRADAGPHGSSYSRLLIAIAVTPGASEPDAVQELESELGQHLRVVRLKELSEAQLRELGNRVAWLYCRAYGIGNGEAAAEKTVTDSLRLIAREAEGRNPRRFIRLLLEKLDVLYA